MQDNSFLNRGIFELQRPYKGLEPAKKLIQAPKQTLSSLTKTTTMKLCLPLIADQDRVDKEHNHCEEFLKEKRKNSHKERYETQFPQHIFCLL